MLKSTAKTLSFITSAALCAATPSFAQERAVTLEGKDEPDAIHWPNTARPELGISEFSTEFDGYYVSMLLLRASGTSIEMVKHPGIDIRPPSSERYSVEMATSSMPGIVLGLSYFKANEFLPDLSEESWAGYKHSLTRERPETEIVFENSNIETPVTPYVFGKQFRQIGYELNVGNSVAKKREIFAFLDQVLLVVSVTGSKNAIDANWQQVDRFISELSLK